VRDKQFSRIASEKGNAQLAQDLAGGPCEIAFKIGRGRTAIAVAEIAILL
jgi:hypothetical protein